METREVYTVDAPTQSKKLLRLADDLHQWFKVEAARQHRSVNAEMIMALEAYRNSRDIATIE
jgi:plasmid stability protein